MSTTTQNPAGPAGAAKTKTRIGVLFGGTSSEKEISLATGRYILNLLDPSKFAPVAIYMDYHARLWQIPPKLVLSNTTIDVENRLEGNATRVKYEELPEKIDFAFIALLGKVGEDGTIQGLLELLRVPYSGSGILPSAVSMNKRVTKDLFNARGIAVAKDLRVTTAEYPEKISAAELTKQIEQTLTFPVIVKPIAEGSSVGVACVRTQAELEAALAEAFKWDREVLIEEFIEGQEFMCVVFGTEEPIAMLPSEVEFSGDIFTYESKYMPGKAEYHTPIRAPQDKIKEIQDIAISVYKMLGIKGYGRVDGFLKDNKIYISEPHTGTIMVPSSYVFQQAALQDAMAKGALKGKGGMKGKGGNKFNPRGFITAIVEMGMAVHTWKQEQQG